MCDQRQSRTRLGERSDPLHSGHGQSVSPEWKKKSNRIQTYLCLSLYLSLYLSIYLSLFPSLYLSISASLRNSSRLNRCPKVSQIRSGKTRCGFHTRPASLCSSYSLFTVPSLSLSFCFTPFCSVSSSLPIYPSLIISSSTSLSHLLSLPLFSLLSPFHSISSHSCLLLLSSTSASLSLSLSIHLSPFSIAFYSSLLHHSLSIHLSHLNLYHFLLMSLIFSFSLSFFYPSHFLSVFSLFLSMSTPLSLSINLYFLSSLLFALSLSFLANCHLLFSFLLISVTFHSSLSLSLI